MLSAEFKAGASGSAAPLKHDREKTAVDAITRQPRAGTELESYDGVFIWNDGPDPVLEDPAGLATIKNLAAEARGGSAAPEGGTMVGLQIVGFDRDAVTPGGVRSLLLSDTCGSRSRTPLPSLGARKKSCSRVTVKRSEE